MPRLLPLFALSVILLSGCSNDPAPSQNLLENLGATKMATTRVGTQPLMVDGCEVNVHRVTTGSKSFVPDFTLAVAKCPTATVTVTSQSCGKACQEDDILVQPGVAVDPLVEQRNKRVAELRKQLDAVSQELSRIEASSSR